MHTNLEELPRGLTAVEGERLSTGSVWVVLQDLVQTFRSLVCTTAGTRTHSALISSPELSFARERSHAKHLVWRFQLCPAWNSWTPVHGATSMTRLRPQMACHHQIPHQRQLREAHSRASTKCAQFPKRLRTRPFSSARKWPRYICR
jgi:hypothetical protein